MPLENPSNRLLTFNEEATNSILICSGQPASKIWGRFHFDCDSGENMVSRSFYCPKSLTLKLFRPPLTVSSPD